MCYQQNKDMHKLTTNGRVYVIKIYYNNSNRLKHIYLVRSENLVR